MITRYKFTMSNDHDKKTEPYATELAALADQIAGLDEEQALEVLEDAFDHACALLSEQHSAGKSNVTLDEMTKSLGLDGRV